MPLPNPLPLNVGLTEVYEELDALYALQGISDLVGDGVTDDRAQLASDDAALGTGEALILAPGTYLVNSNLTISHVVQFRPGAKLKPASGVTITLSKGYDAGDFQHAFDISASGVISSPQRAGGYATPWHFGALGDGVTDDWAAIRAALDSGAVRIYFPYTSTSYYSTKCFNLKSKYVLYGDTGHNGKALVPFSTIKFANSICGFILHTPRTNASDSGYANVKISPDTTGSNGTIISGLRIIRGTGAATTVDGVSHGIRMRATGAVRDCMIEGFAGNGLHIVGSVSGGDETYGEANQFALHNIRISSCFHGVYVDGNDVNAGVGVGVNCVDNQGWGIYDSSFLGNTWVACHTSNNTLGSYKTDNINARSVFAGCYEEGDQPLSDIISPAIHVGGLSTPGAGNAPQIANICGHLNRGVVNKTGVGATTVTAAGSGYTSAPSVTFGAPSGAATATATATIGALDFLSGKIVNIAITSGGAGYSAIPTVTIGGDGSGATAVAQLNGGVVDSITVTAAGSGYTTAPITVAAPTETTALGTAYIDVAAGTLLHIVVTTAGAGYTAAPGITLSGGGGTGAAATCALSTGTVTTVEVNRSDNTTFASAFAVMREDVVSGGRWEMKMDFSTGNIHLQWGGSISPFLITGQKSNLFFGRRTVQLYAPFFSRGLYVGANSTDARQVFSATSIPTSGENAKGDLVLNSNISELGSGGSKYILLGWSRLTTGAGHVLNTDWLEARCLTGN